MQVSTRIGIWGVSGMPYHPLHFEAPTFFTSLVLPSNGYCEENKDYLFPHNRMNRSIKAQDFDHRYSLEWWIKLKPVWDFNLALDKSKSCNRILPLHNMFYILVVTTNDFFPECPVSRLWNSPEVIGICLHFWLHLLCVPDEGVSFSLTFSSHLFSHLEEASGEQHNWNYVQLIYSSYVDLILHRQ